MFAVEDRNEKMNEIEVTYLRDPGRTHHLIEIKCEAQTWFIDRHSSIGMRVGKAPKLSVDQDWERFDLLEVIDNNDDFQS